MPLAGTGCSTDPSLPHSENPVGIKIPFTHVYPCLVAEASLDQSYTEDGRGNEPTFPFQFCSLLKLVGTTLSLAIKAGNFSALLTSGYFSCHEDPVIG